jgi:hypothetical protein
MGMQGTSTVQKSRLPQVMTGLWIIMSASTKTMRKVHKKSMAYTPKSFPPIGI